MFFVIGFQKKEGDLSKTQIYKNRSDADKRFDILKKEGCYQIALILFGETKEDFKPLRTLDTDGREIVYDD